MNNDRTGEDKMAYKRVYKSGKTVWIGVIGRENGNRGIQTAFNTKKEALTYEQQTEIPKKEINYTFGQLAQIFLNNTKPPDLSDKNTQWANHKGRLKNHVLPMIERKIAKNLTTQDVVNIHSRSIVNRFNNKNSNVGVSAETLGKINTSINVVLDYAVNLQLILKNQLKGKLAKITPSETDADFYNKQQRGLDLKTDVIFAPSDKDVGKYLKSFKDNDTHYHYYYLLATTGCRLSEIRTLKWQNIDLEKKTINVIHSKTRSGYRSITINDIQVRVLEKQRENMRLGFLDQNKMLSDQDYVFCNLKTIDNPELKGLYYKSSMTNTWVRNRTKLLLQQQIDQVEDDKKISPVRLHDLRHYHASVLIRSGMSVVQISTRLGHKSPKITLDKYGHLFADDQDNSSDIATEKLPLLD